MHAHRALDEYKRQVRCGEVHQTRMFFYILLNLAICKLFCGSIRSAFEDLKGCARLMNNSPLVWMRLAECSLLVHNETITRERPTRPHDLQQEITNESQMEPTLQLAIQALRVCLSLIADHEMTLTAMETPGDGNAPCARIPVTSKTGCLRPLIAPTIGPKGLATLLVLPIDDDTDAFEDSPVISGLVEHEK
ncbi:CCR4-NOT transcription complex subunit 10-A-like [Tropilaelaps mercedesae]|uniref:CCR4-NOT transcription complex subunit 10 n=1 Tax=Tropilaelaps mercedesae TaxID=418985 RepID=A0A1V9X6A1_9ACAR|nr:CCR4-NOT transcription complex subunit 10-A-like [Tropilaelaps mercedesae]